MNREKRAGLYIHIPFCRRKCSYCHFYSSADIGRLPDVLQALFLEISSGDVGIGEFDTIYIGGGTPSLLDARDIESILARIYARFRIAPHPEITVEVNPADQDISWFRTLRTLGVNRLNLGVQSFSDAELSFLDRRHSSAEALSAIGMTASAGFGNVGLDLIYGLPGQSLADWQKTLDRALSFRPAHLACYELTIETDTPLAKRHEEETLAFPDEGRQWDFFQITAERLGAAGYIHYEVSNFARDEGLMSRHNRKYWNRSSYLGMGPSAHSYHGGRRWWNHASLDRYLSLLSQGQKPVAEEEMLTSDQMRLEDFFLGLRTREGIDCHAIKYLYGDDLLARKQQMLSALAQGGCLTIRGNRIQPTLKGLAVADRLAMTLFDEENLAGVAVNERSILHPGAMS